MTKALVCVMAGLALAFVRVFSIDAEVARRDRADGLTPTGCLFECNCWAVR